MVQNVISGGQTGVDQIGLEVAHSLGIATGGTAPKGFKTEEGPNPALPDKSIGRPNLDSANISRKSRQKSLNDT